MPIEVALLGLAIGALAIAFKLTERRQRAWVERDLKRGDLRTLSNFAFRRKGRPPSIVVNRLKERGFLARGSCRITLKGWIAVLLRHTSARRPELKHE
jgi:hypothetical protein